MSRLALSIAVAGCLALAACHEEGCAETGGTVATAQCCPTAPDLPNTCAVGACGCAPENSLPRTVCDCPAGTCFDGTSCVGR